jgi:hypothetical protein
MLQTSGLSSRRRQGRFRGTRYHTAAIAARHHLTVQDEDFERAATRGAESDALAAQNAAQQAPAGDGKIVNLVPQTQGSL